ncbi:50S ribosomal protein L29 [bacterium]|nr:50S ribosomal protein L29 [bacterium]
MKRTDIDKYKGMDEKKLWAEVVVMRTAVADMMLRMKQDTQPKTHLISEKKRTIAALLTILREKRS